MARKLAIIVLVALSAALALLPGVLAASPTSSQGSTASAPKPGDLDPTFDADGKSVTDFGGSEGAYGVAIQPDGKIVAAGITQDTVTFATDFALARYGANGGLDSSFGSGGRVRTDFGGSSEDRAFAVAIQADGKIVAAGLSNSPGITNFTDFALARYNPDGSLDSSFGGTGKVVTNLLRIDLVRGLAIQPDGKIVAAGLTRAAASGLDYDFAVVRYNPNGSLDSSFGGVGYVITPFTTSYDGAFSVVIQADGKIVAAGVANITPTSGPQHVALARYNPDGSLDGSFDGDGKVEGLDLGSLAFSVALQRDGKLVVAGGNVARFGADGRPDTAFGSNGKVVLSGNSGADVVLVQQDRKLVVAGVAYGQQTNDLNDFLVARLNPDGSVDTTFGDDGQVRTDVGANSYDEVNAALLQSDRRIVLAGWTAPNTQSPADFALARYLNPAPCRVPNVRGKKLAAARSAITKAHCSLGKVKRKVSKNVKRGRVIAQSPKAGTTLPNLGKVNLVVSKGRRR